jgi:apolipoprotein N-acyltransferase
LKELLWPRPGERLLPALSGFILACSFPPLHLLVPPFVGLVPFALWLHALPADAEGRRSAVRGSLVFGAVCFGMLFYWILAALIWFTTLAVPAFLASMLLLMSVAALFGWMLHRMTNGVGVPLWLALPVAWTAAEWFRAHWPGSLAFPWLGLGTSLTGFPELVGIAEVVGSRGVTFWIALVNGLVAGIVLRLREGGLAAATEGRRRDALGRGAAGKDSLGGVGLDGALPADAILRPGVLRRVVVLAAVVAAPMAWGVWRAGDLEMHDVARVAVVQPNIPEHIKLDRAAVFDSTFAALDRLLPRIPPGSVDLVVLPEVVLPLYPRAPNATQPMDRMQTYASASGAPFLFGALGYEESGGGSFMPLNSAFLMDAVGLSDYQYDKRYLVPMVERVPLLPEAWLGGFGWFGSYGAGTGWPLAHAGGADFGVLICYESTYAEASRAFRLAGADVLVNITNDAWYGREPLYARTTALWQHPAHMVMRAIENRVGVARAANTGISLFIDPVGRVHDATRLFEPDVRVATVRTTDVVTLYTRFGDVIGNAAALAALLLAAASFGFAGGGRAGGSGA